MRHVPQSEGNRIHIHGRIRHRNGLRIAGHPLEIVEPAAVNRPVPPDSQHIFVKVTKSNDRAGTHLFTNSKGDIPGASSHVKIM